MVDEYGQADGRGAGSIGVPPVGAVLWTERVLAKRAVVGRMRSRERCARQDAGHDRRDADAPRAETPIFPAQRRGCSSRCVVMLAARCGVGFSRGSAYRAGVMRMLFQFAAMVVCLWVAPVRAQLVTALAPRPDWSRLDAFQETMTRGEFERLLDKVYAPGGVWRDVMRVTPEGAEILKTLAPVEKYTLRFAKNRASAKPVKRTWRTAAELPARFAEKPLAGLRLALDPGHIGGTWAVMEERSFARPGDKPVREGDMTLLVAKLAAEKLRALGAKVWLVREDASPLSPHTVDALREPARKELALLAIGEVRENYDHPRDPQKMNTVQWQAEKMFYRVAEIRGRAEIVNAKMQPDLVVCIHFNADDWGDPETPVFTERSDLHVLVHGCFSAGELRYDDERFEMLFKLLNGSHTEETAAAGPMVAALAKATGLPPFTYTMGNAVRVNGDEYLWARNLLANRLYECPSVYLEPYRMNHEETYARIQAGDFDGEKMVAGKMRRSIFREYADAIVEGLRGYYSPARSGR